MKIPKGHQAVMPYLIINGAAAFLDFVKKVFPVQVTHESRNDDATLGHCEIQIHGSTIMFANGSKDWKRFCKGVHYLSGKLIPVCSDQSIIGFCKRQNRIKAACSF